jgi:hypothetical protein
MTTIRMSKKADLSMIRNKVIKLETFIITKLL